MSKIQCLSALVIGREDIQLSVENTVPKHIDDWGVRHSIRTCSLHVEFCIDNI